jgi:hypothetical protein
MRGIENILRLFASDFRLSDSFSRFRCLSDYRNSRSSRRRMVLMRARCAAIFWRTLTWKSGEV